MTKKSHARLARGDGVDESRPPPVRGLRARIAVLTPTYSGDVVHECALAMQLATMHCLVNGVALDWIFAAGFSLIGHGRNWLTAEFLSRKEFSHCLWLDADLGFDPRAIMRMYLRNLDAVGGCYITKSPTAPIYPYQAKGPVIDGLQEVIKLPGGFLLLSRRAVQAVADGCPAYEIDHDSVKRMSPQIFEVLVRDGMMHGEDFVMNERLSNAGFKLYAETDISFAHIGRYSWNANLARTLAEEEAKGIEGEQSPARWAEHEEAPKALAE